MSTEIRGEECGSEGARRTAVMVPASTVAAFAGLGRTFGEFIRAFALSVVYSLLDDLALAFRRRKVFAIR